MWCIVEKKELYDSLLMLTGRNFVLLNSVQGFIEIEAWLLLTFFIYLYNQLSSVHSIVTY